jgi:hypothetical protein
LVFIALLSIFTILNRPKLIDWKVIIAFTGLFLAGIGREFTVGISLGTLVLLISLKLLQRKYPTLTIPEYNFIRLFPGFLIGFSGYLFARWLIPNNHEFEWSITYTLKDTFRTNLNPINFIYPFYAGLGIFFFVILANFSTKITLKSFVQKLRTEKHSFLIAIFALIAIVIAFLGGPDRDRYLMWYFPLFGYLAIKSFQNIISFLRKKFVFVGFLIIVTMCWTRFYIPAIPHLVFDKNFPVQTKTDYNPKYFAGFRLLEKQRLPLKKFEVVPDSSIIMDKRPAYQIAYFAENQTLNAEGLKHMPMLYKHHANYIPFPLGIPTNQYELLTTHPFWGNYRVRTALLAQWLALQLILGFALYKKSIR